MKVLIPAGHIFQHCYSKYGIPAINVWSLEQIHGLFRAAQKAKAPFIVQFTPVARNYAHPDMLIAMVQAAAKIYSDTVFAIHLDHGDRMQALQAIDAGGYTSVMIDASYEPYEINVKLTREVVQKAHAKNMEVEAELGVLSGIEDEINIDEKNSKYTQPSEVEDFVKRTGCDSLAVAVGTSHGAYKFSSGQGLQFDILEEIQNRLPGFPLVLHGGSSINFEEIQRINAAGGQLDTDARGVSEEDLLKAIQYGICKINIATDARLIWARVHREFFSRSPALFDPIVPGKIYMEAFKKFIIEKFELLKAVGKADELKYFTDEKR